MRTGDLSTKAKYRKIFSDVSDLLDQGTIPVKMSEYSYKLIQQTDWFTIKEQRQKNAQKLIEIFKRNSINLVQDKSGLCDLYVAFTVSNRDKIQSILSQKGIFNTVIWPLRKEQQEACNVAEKTCSTMLAAPCDQRYTIADMEYIGEEIARVINEEKNNDSWC